MHLNLAGSFQFHCSLVAFISFFLLLGWLAGWLAGWLPGWLAAWLAGGLEKWLAGCFGLQWSLLNPAGLLSIHYLPLIFNKGWPKTLRPNA